MKHIKTTLCFLLCLFMLVSCGKTDNTSYFKSQLQNSPEEMKYMPVIFSDYENKEEIKISVLKDNTVTYSLSGDITAKSGYKYQTINLHIKKHSGDINASIDSVVDSYVEEKDSAVKAVKHEANGRKYAITYEIRPDLKYTVLNVIYPAAENISVYFALRLMETPENINDKILDKICNDLEIVKI